MSRRRGEWFDTCTAREEFFAPEEEENDRNIQEENPQGEPQEAIVLHEEGGEEHSAPSSSVSKNPRLRIGMIVKFDVNVKRIPGL